MNNQIPHSDEASIRMPEAVTCFHAALIARENQTWQGRAGEQISTYVWRRWYRPGLLASARLLAAAAVAADADGLLRVIGGTARTATRVAEAAQAAGVLRVGAGGRFEWLLPSRHEYVAADLDTLPARPELGQIPCTPPGRRRVAELVLADLPWAGDVLLLGDDDLISPAIAASGLTATVLDVDDRLAQVLTGAPAPVRFVSGDIRSVPTDLHHRFDAVVMDPADGSIALAAWLRAAAVTLAEEPGARAYLAIAPARLGHRWAALVADAAQLGLVPCGHVSRCKEYRDDGGRLAAVTDCWIFERVPLPSYLPHPYLGIETFR
jgi:hypothetical protein